MCAHSNWQKFGEVWACLRCGLTKLPDGKIIFDRKLPSYINKKKKKRGKK